MKYGIVDPDDTRFFILTSRESLDILDITATNYISIDSVSELKRGQKYAIV